MSERRSIWTLGLFLSLMMLVTVSCAEPPSSALAKAWPRTDFSKTTVALSELQSGGPPKDGIPAIDAPKFVESVLARDWLDPAEPVIVLELNGEHRAYPLQIMLFHEIVNDLVGEVPVAVTFCPLCNSTIVFDRRVAGQVLDFGTTGWLRKSDMLMYDRQTESWWQQFIGAGIIGQHAGTILKQIPARIVAFADYRKAYPKGLVLSRKTGSSRPYGRNPYRGYDRVGDSPFLFTDPVDPRLPAMERVIFIRNGKSKRIYPFSAFKKAPVINDSLDGEPLLVMAKEGMLSVLDAPLIKRARKVPAVNAFVRRVADRELHFAHKDGKLLDRETGSEWNYMGHAVAGKLKGTRLPLADSGIHFAFAWLAFHPDTEIYRAP